MGSSGCTRSWSRSLVVLRGRLPRNLPYAAAIQRAFSSYPVLQLLDIHRRTMPTDVLRPYCNLQNPICTLESSKSQPNERLGLWRNKQALTGLFLCEALPLLLFTRIEESRMCWFALPHSRRVVRTALLGVDAYSPCHTPIHGDKGMSEPAHCRSPPRYLAPRKLGLGAALGVVHEFRSCVVC